MTIYHYFLAIGLAILLVLLVAMGVWWLVSHVSDRTMFLTVVLVAVMFIMAGVFGMAFNAT